MTTDSIEAKVNWTDSSRRYASCLENYGPPIERVEYFRRLLKDASPSFAHHAIALLMSYDKLHRIAFTTNFDKLIEQAFTIQGICECQPIRIPEEALYIGHEPDKCYLLKLHGDYDTHNTLNTPGETLIIPDFFSHRVSEILSSRGLLVLGSGGNEESIYRFFNDLLQSNSEMLLARGIRWGVYVGDTKPDGLSSEASSQLVDAAIEAGNVNRRIVEVLGHLDRKDRPCYLFPVWDAGGFLMRMIGSLGDPNLNYTAHLFLDHEMRISSLFQSNGIPSEVAYKHLERLRKQRDRRQIRELAAAQPVRRVSSVALSAPGASAQVMYGDITSRALLSSEFAGGRRRAVVSTDDTLLSAGGGVANAIVQSAGRQYILNEMAKLAPIRHGTVAVTSGGNLPVAYIFHAAALEIAPNGDYLVTPGMVREVILDVLAKAQELGVACIFVPLVAAGLAGLSASDSLAAILQACKECKDLSDNFQVVIVVYSDEELGKEEILRLSQVEVQTEERTTSTEFSPPSPSATPVG
jgi:O-acetyl-ADP-ribose deacetylase